MVVVNSNTNSNLGSRVFVMGMLRDDGTIAADEVYQVGEQLGFTTHQIRLVLARLVDEGLFAREGRGRQAELRATDRHARLHEPELDWLRLAYRQDSGGAPWDGRWHLVGFSLDEERRPARTALRELLTAMAAAPMAGGLYVHALDIGPEVRTLAASLGVAEHVTVAAATELDVGGVTDPGTIAAHLWPLDEIAAAYRSFVDTFVDTVGATFDADGLGDPTVELAHGFEVVTAFGECTRRDPLLPPELLPADWPGRAAREVLRRCSDRLMQARSAGGVPQLFSRYDRLFAELHGDEPLTVR
jgi:phenylacetic acid degradation operon negative regulatory protein